MIDNLESHYNFIALPKDSALYYSYELAPNLFHYEFKCRCSYPDCNITLIHPSTLDSWELSREDFKRPMKVTSGYRCQKHNKDVGGVDNSRHPKGLAVDISAEGYAKAEREMLHKILRENFDVVIDQSSFFHCHNLILTF